MSKAPKPHTIIIRQSPKNRQFYTTILRGKIVFDGAEGHKRKAVADHAITELIANLKSGNYKIVDDLLPPKKVAGNKSPKGKEPKKPKKTPAKKPKLLGSRATGQEASASILH